MKIISAQEYKTEEVKWFSRKDLAIVRKIISDVYNLRDKGLHYWSQKFDQRAPQFIEISAGEQALILDQLEEKIKKSLSFAASNIRKFAQEQFRQFCSFSMEIGTGVFLKQLVQPLEKVAVYVPAGRKPLVSSLLMGVIPAQVAGVKEIVIVSPPDKQGRINPCILSAGLLLGVNRFYVMGGVQAIAALAFGTEKVLKVDKIVGPGNKFVALAKKELCCQVGIDLIAGPSEIVVVADQYAEAELVAADLLAQAEHDPEARAILISSSEKLARKVLLEIRKQLKFIATAAVIRKALQKNGLIILVDKMREAQEIVKKIAPEHLSLHLKNFSRLWSKFSNYGSLFFPVRSCEVYADYCSGLNHILPTAGTARFSSGLSVKDFLKFPTVLEVRADSSFTITMNQVAGILAGLEELPAHFQAAARRRDFFLRKKRQELI